MAFPDDCNAEDKERPLVLPDVCSEDDEGFVLVPDTCPLLITPELDCTIFVEESGDPRLCD